MLVLDNLVFEVEKEAQTIVISEEGHNLLHMPLDDIEELISWLQQAKWTIQGDKY